MTWRDKEKSFGDREKRKFLYNRQTGDLLSPEWAIWETRLRIAPGVDALICVP